MPPQGFNFYMCIMNVVGCVAVFHGYYISSRITLTENVEEDERRLNMLTSLGQEQHPQQPHCSGAEVGITLLRTLKSMKIGH